MARNPEHALLAKTTHDEEARQRFVSTLKLFIGRQLRSGNRKIYESAVAPQFEAAHGHPPETAAEIRPLMESNIYYQVWSALNRAVQEQMWEAVGETLLREEPRLQEAYETYHDSPARKGSLELDPDIEIPNVIQNTEIHLQPGGYALNRNDKDILAGAFYEAGGALYSKGQGIGTGESKGEIIIRFLAERFPDFNPQRILDMACSAGSSSTPYAEAFPEAEVHAIDVGAGLLRYAHGRAEALGLPVHFHQRDVTHTGFDDNSFDLIISHNAMHELSQEASEGMFAECFRLLRPGGVCVHQDVPLRYDRLSPYEKFDFGWDKEFNNEPFWETYATNDCQAMLEKAGFDKNSIDISFVAQKDSPMTWYVVSARKV